MENAAKFPYHVTVINDIDAKVFFVGALIVAVNTVIKEMKNRKYYIDKILTK